MALVCALETSNSWQGRVCRGPQPGPLPEAHLIPRPGSVSSWARMGPGPWAREAASCWSGCRGTCWGDAGSL